MRCNPLSISHFQGGDKEGDPQLFFRGWKLEGFLAFFEHPMAEDGVGIGKNRRGLHGSLAAQPKAVNGSGRNHDARLTLNFIFFFADTDEAFAFDIEKNQNLLGIMGVKGSALLTFEIM